jgi:hypothetical protein
MAKTKNYSKEEFDLIAKRLKSMNYYNSIEFIEEISNELDRKPWSVYTFIIRKFGINLLPDKDIRRQFGLIHFSAIYTIKRSKDKRDKTKQPPIKHAPIKKNESEMTEKFVRPAAKYSNLDINAWKDSLLEDDPRFSKGKAKD